MKQNYLYMLAFCLILLLTSRETNAQTLQYTGGSTVRINISDGKKSYEFTAPQIKGRYNGRQKRFEFLMTVSEISTKQNNSFLLSLFNFIFHTDQSDQVNMYVYLPSETRNFDNFINPKTLLLTGQVEIAGKTYQLPITMNLKYTSGTLYYGLQGQFSSDFGVITASADEKPIYPREVQFVVPESPMGIYLEE